MDLFRSSLHPHLHLSHSPPSAHPSVFPTPTFSPARQGSVKPPTALWLPPSSSPFASGTDTLPLRRVLLGSGSRLWAGLCGPHFLCTCLQSGVAEAWRLGMTALGEISSPGTHHHPFPPSPLCSPLGGSSGRTGRGPGTGVLASVEVTASHLTAAETEAQAGGSEVTGHRTSHRTS